MVGFCRHIYNYRTLHLLVLVLGTASLLGTHLHTLSVSCEFTYEAATSKTYIEKCKLTTKMGGPFFDEQIHIQKTENLHAHMYVVHQGGCGMRYFHIFSGDANELKE